MFSSITVVCLAVLSPTDRIDVMARSFIDIELLVDVFVDITGVDLASEYIIGNGVWVAPVICLDVSFFVVVVQVV